MLIFFIEPFQALACGLRARFIGTLQDTVFSKSGENRQAVQIQSFQIDFP